MVLTVIFSAGASFAAVSFTDGEHVKLGYKTAASPVWKAKALPGAGAGRIFFVGAPLVISGAYGDTSSWPDSNVMAYFNGAFLDANFSPDEISAGVLTPYGDNPVYDVVIPDVSSVVAPAMAIAPNPVKTIRVRG
jgi:hypothetical protein